MLGRLPWIGAAAVAVAAMLGAQRLPSVEQVIARQRVGGKALSVVLQGRCESTVQEESGPFEIWISSPRVMLSLNDGDLRSGYDGAQVWRAQKGHPTMKLPGPLTEAVAVLDPARRLRWKELYPRMQVVRREVIGGRGAFVVETEPGAPTAGRFYIDSQDGNLVRADVLPGMSFELSDYRMVGGWPIPFLIVEKTPEGSVYTLRITKSDVVEPIDPSRFAAP